MSVDTRVYRLAAERLLDEMFGAPKNVTPIRLDGIVPRDGTNDPVWLDMASDAVMAERRDPVTDEDAIEQGTEQDERPDAPVLEPIEDDDDA